MRKIRIGTRGSRLALWQTDFVVNKLLELDDRLDIEKVTIKTTGDKFLDVALSRIGDKGLFTKEIEKELQKGTIDMAVHSMKDMPTRITDGLAIGAVLPRENPKDVLLSREGQKLAALPVGASVGTSSLRRKAQLLAMRPDLNIVDLRGNIDTRIRRLQNGELDAIVVAAAGVARLGYEGMVTEELEFLPAVGQGAIMVEIRDDAPDIRELVAKLDNRSTRLAVAAERAFLGVLEGGCQIPVGCLGSVKDGLLTLEGLVSDLEGKKVFRSRLSGTADEAEDLGRKLAHELMNQGADVVLKQIRNQVMDDE